MHLHLYLLFSILPGPPHCLSRDVLRMRPTETYFRCLFRFLLIRLICIRTDDHLSFSGMGLPGNTEAPPFTTYVTAHTHTHVCCPSTQTHVLVQTGTTPCPVCVLMYVHMSRRWSKGVQGYRAYRDDAHVHVIILMGNVQLYAYAHKLIYSMHIRIESAAYYVY